MSKATFQAGLAAGIVSGMRFPMVVERKKTVPYLTFASAEPFTLAQRRRKKVWEGTLYYSTDAITWSEWDATTAVLASAEGKGEHRIYMRGVGNTKIGSATSDSFVLSGSGIRCNGNIENLLDYETVARGEHPPMDTYCFGNLFLDCTNLVTPPELPAITLANNCYHRMFQGCTNLTSAPALPATTLANNCYQYMFWGCASLTTPPELPATTLASSCYYWMFNDCTKLTSAPALLATKLEKLCYLGMFRGCDSLIVPPELPAITLASSCYSGMFEFCDALEYAPTLPATTLASGCYNDMFLNCVNLSVIPKLPATTLQQGCYDGMFSGCANIKMSATKTGEYQTAYRIPTSGTGVDAPNYGGDSAADEMFKNTGGTFTGTPSINTTYYTSNKVV